MRKHRIIYDEYGQTGNRLFSYLDTLGWAIVNEGRVIILFPDKILAHFDRLRNSKLIRLPLWGKGQFVWRIYRKLFYYNSTIQKFYKTGLSRKLGFYAGWDLRESMEYYPKVIPQIQELFVPNDDIKHPIDDLFCNLRNNKGKAIIGIHIRRGDYKTAYEGKYWYEDTVYTFYMNQMQQLCPNSVFYISSNERTSDEFLKFPLTDKPVNNAAGDLYALSQCDYIIGPPSTFNCWASFIGRVPLYTMFEPNKAITLASFKVMRSNE